MMMMMMMMMMLMMMQQSYIFHLLFLYFYLKLYTLYYPCQEVRAALPGYGYSSRNKLPRDFALHNYSKMAHIAAHPNVEIIPVVSAPLL